MKRYTIPTIFFAIGVTLQTLFYFSWVDFTLLAVSCLLLTLFLYSLDLQSYPNSKQPTSSFQTETIASEDDSQTLQKSNVDTEVVLDTNVSHGSVFPEVSTAIDDSNDETKGFKTKEILWKVDPIFYARESVRLEERSLFCDTIKEFPFSFTSPKLSSIQYVYFDGTDFKECYWQKSEMLVETDDNPVEWNEWEESQIKESLPAISKNKRKLYVPLTINAKLFGFLCFTSKEGWSNEDIQVFWEETTNLSEKILLKREYAKVTKHPFTKLYTVSHFYQLAKASFEASEKKTLVLFKFIDTNFQSELAIGLNQMGIKHSVLGIGLFQLEENLYAALIPNERLESFSSFFQQFIEELDQLGYPSEVALGYSNPLIPDLKFDVWIKKAYSSLEESILYNAA
ncbi:hypothetical protein LEP1GSC202_0548 [Leptospira yanagawae serovar Saopaulo str. Sao Paulo = ATCC 700523]|uniref:GGDEF domain-containing protein n=1 Tax=Leptospira yanagawae serovar Saopaulo str. Sao Paulo = ATCC 700523 TaxID=1249483 RepID=A0A5E8HFX7_9LEPT|nr:hypothetical protein [Leptospira yanagawae]EOQ90185.1 hypothetical protein LEP1GSC202_0548 [Leptospira yanagawae serovar Saopaulo str. Sao Paulo = ATCC 700523]